MLYELAWRSCLILSLGPTGNLYTEGDAFEENLSLQDHNFRAPESIDGSWKEKYTRDGPNSSESAPVNGKKCGWPIDVFAMGKFLQAVFMNDSCSMPKCLEAPLKRMLSPDHRRRPTCASLLKAPWCVTMS